MQLHFIEEQFSAALCARKSINRHGQQHFTLFSSRRMRPLQEPWQSRRGSHCRQRALGTAPRGHMNVGSVWAGDSTASVHSHRPAKAEEEQTSRVFPLAELPEPAVQALEVGASTALCTQPLFSFPKLRAGLAQAPGSIEHLPAAVPRCS